MAETIVNFDAIPTDGGEWVERSGLIFKFGSYPDKEFSLTPEEYAEANQDLSEVPIDLSHTPTILDGSLGHLFAAEVKGDELHGSVRLPKWLDDLLDSGKRKVSCEWDRATKRLRKLSLVPEPRISDAVLYAAFAASQSMEVQSLIFDKAKFSRDQAVKWAKDHEFHAGKVDETGESFRLRQADPGAFDEGSFRTKELTAGVQAVMGKRKAGGAKMEADEDTDSVALLGSLLATFTARKRSPTLNVAMQHVHDLMGLYPNGCPAVDPASVSFADYPKQRKAVRAIHDATLEHGAMCSGSKSKFGASSPGRPKVSLKEKLGRVLFGAGAAEVEFAPDVTDDQARAALAALTGDDPAPPPSPKPPTTPPPPPPVSFADSPEAKALQAKIEELERKDAERTAEAERLRVEARDQKAVMFADEAKRASIITPAVEADLATFYGQLLEDDHATAATVTFSEGSTRKEGSRAAAFAAFLKRLPKHHLTVDLIDPQGRLKDGASALFNRETADPSADGTDDASIKKLMSLTERGRQQWDAAHTNGK